MIFTPSTICNEIINQTCYERISSIMLDTKILIPLLIILSFHFLFFLLYGLKGVYTKRGRKFLLLQKNYLFPHLLILIINTLIILLILIYPVYLLWWS